MKIAKTVLPPARPARPAASAPPQISIETMKPIRPRRIKARRPRRSARWAQTGAIATQTRAERLNAAATPRSATPRSRPIAGSRLCIAVLPAAATSITEKSRANLSRDRPKPFISRAFFGLMVDFRTKAAALAGCQARPDLPTHGLSAKFWNHHVGILGRSAKRRTVCARRGRRAAVALPQGLHQAPRDGRLYHPVVQGGDRQDARPGRLGELQIVRRIWAGGRHLHRACAAADGARRDPDRDRHQ